MPWAIALRETESQRVMLWDGQQKIDPDDPRFEQEVHIVPFTEEDDEWMTFGLHDFTRECCCKPRVETQVNDRDKIIHNDKFQ
jgi:hypothetical protein